jgi:hypothetical protein
MGSEERLDKMKEYINNLSKKVDKNMDNYMNYEPKDYEKDIIIEKEKVKEEINEANNLITNINYPNSEDYPNQYISNHLQKFNQPLYTNDANLDKIYGKNFGEYKQVNYLLILTN